jgi:16S rRNA (guanine(966)-N(2))-methyltransferase RsmD
MLRVGAGEFKGVTLATPPGIRATGAKVRLALFNILGEAVAGARVLDVFAGSGALGIEALSRGAAFVAFIESDTRAILAIRDNLDRLAPDLPRHAWRVAHLDAVRGIGQLAKAESPFDIIICDPPYRTDDARKALNAIVECAILAPSGIVVIEHDQRTILPDTVGYLRQGKRHRYGDTVLSLYMGSP